MNNFSNPFVIGKYVSKEYFCDRIAETELLVHHIKNGRNVTIMSERRMGKTGLIEHTFANMLPENDYYTFLIDIYTSRNLREMVCQLAKEQLQTILTHIVDTKRFTFEDKYATLTEKQKAVIKAMANEYPSEVSPTSKDFIIRHNLKTASSVQTAMKGLMDKGIVNEWRGTKQISDLLFVLWLKKY